MSKLRSGFDPFILIPMVGLFYAIQMRESYYKGTVQWKQSIDYVLMKRL